MQFRFAPSCSLNQKATPSKKLQTRKLTQRAGDYVAYLIVRFTIALIQTLPTDMGNAICKSLAWLLAGPLKARGKATFENLRRVFPDAGEPELQELNYRMWHSLLLMVCEIAWVRRRLHLTNWADHVSFVNQREMLERLLSRRPLICVTGHFGNFEISGYTLGLMGIGTTTIARTLDNPYLNDWVLKFRETHQQKMLDKDGCAEYVEGYLASGGVLSILADQFAGPKGYWTHVMGVPTSCHKALALFSLTSGAPMLAGYTRRLNAQPMQFETACQAIVDPADGNPETESIGALTEWYNGQLEDAVAMSVEQYWWLHRRWRDPSPKIAARLEKRLAKQAKAA